MCPQWDRIGVEDWTTAEGRLYSRIQKCSDTQIYHKFLYLITEGVMLHSIKQHSGLLLIQFKSQFAMNRTIRFNKFTEKYVQWPKCSQHMA